MTYSTFLHWNGNCFHYEEIFIMDCTGSFQVAICSVASDENFVEMMTFPFQCVCFLFTPQVLVTPVVGSIVSRFTTFPLFKTGYVDYNDATRRLKSTATRWRHQMEPFSALLALCAGNSPAPVNSPHKGQWRGALMFSLICARINDWVNSREAGDLRRHRGHYDVNVMKLRLCWTVYYANNRKYTKATHCWLMWGESTSHRWIPHINGH